MAVRRQLNIMPKLTYVDLKSSSPISNGHQTSRASLFPALNFSWETGRLLSQETYHFNTKGPRLTQWKAGWPLYAPSANSPVEKAFWGDPEWLFDALFLTQAVKNYQTSEESSMMNESPKQEDKKKRELGKNKTTQDAFSFPTEE